MKDDKAVNFNGSKIIGLINLKYGKKACRDNFLPWMGDFPEKEGKGQQVDINLNLLWSMQPDSIWHLAKHVSAINM